MGGLSESCVVQGMTCERQLLVCCEYVSWLRASFSGASTVCESASPARAGPHHDFPRGTAYDNGMSRLRWTLAGASTRRNRDPSALRTASTRQFPTKRTWRESLRGVDAHYLAMPPTRSAHLRGRSTWESRGVKRSETKAGRRGLFRDGTACPPGLAIRRPTVFRDTWIVKTVETSDNSYLYLYMS
jgi:hypothetical protein